ncbi:MAG: anti-sigma factor family protein [Calditrichia bacterium]
MKCDLSKEQLIDFIYDELNTEGIKVVEQHIKTCIACREEVAALKSTSSTLTEWPDAPLPYRMRFEATQQQSFFDAVATFKGSLSPIAKRWTMAMGATLAAFILLAASSFSLTYQDGNLQAGFNLVPSQTSSGYLDADRIALQQATLDSMRYMIQASEKRQRQDRNQKLTKFARAIESQRSQDLQLLGEGLDVFQTFNEQRFETTERQLRRADKLLQRIITVPESKNNSFEINGLPKRRN